MPPPDEPTPRRSGDPVRTAVSAALRIVGILAVAAAAWVARDVFLLGFVSILLAVLFSFPVGWLARFLPRGVAVLVVLATFLGGFAALGALAAPTLGEQVDAARESAPRAIANARRWLVRVERDAGVKPDPSRRAPPGGEPQPETEGQIRAKVAEKAVPAVFAAVSAITEIVLVVVLAAFLVHEPDLYRRGLRRLVPPRHEPAFDETWSRLRDGLRRWVGGILVSMTLMGLFTGIGLLAAGIESWLLLAVLTFLGTFVPYLGAIASAVPGLLVALAQSPRHLLLALAVYLGVHLVEGYVVQPLVMRRAVEIKPALLLAGQALFGAVFGLLGIVIATPAVACLQIAIEYLWVERRLGKESVPAAGAAGGA